MAVFGKIIKIYKANNDFIKEASGEIFVGY